MATGIVRETASPVVYTDAPLWMRTVLNNAAAYGDFMLDMTRGIKRIDSLIADHLSTGDDDKARIMLGKREMLIEMRHIVEAYRKEQGGNNAR